ncbi:hypothetical protein COCC4DRAFT_155556 [Bipolaris maydis ATCC 48331]|uniref:Major facilitator superfamily (MFS) profile domain-containing protein n=2 Tax=Cochliobolus heterostrophus TaxID=5016 RepID=M2UBV9_COCH5|nr:uncharacterized protein COCC4DRAFT_155556 [Bipolaris maydis ATCC 48331]EMD85392.1 hypothetical protein COCHEDRAFT_1119039 [Bipolaris maydis C5]KAJ5024610.1 fungal trichothecene efflux pump [Bipolaris maydis]ENH98518.1 hypothetical protein COCC4DRAFT_155556 [Bipolaris maydis ATCC 48331]KAJ5032042.1 putative major facilitator superfamily transporter [Bipolaris maydis]KAJ5056812.1 putative major facilitator superfamily transporter [Bipolaris maydis]
MASIATTEEKHLEPPWGTSVERTERIDDRPSDFLDPHRAALEENPDRAERPSARTILAVVFLALSYVCPIACGFALPVALVEQIGQDLGDPTKITWLVGGWSIASSVSFSVAGSFSDIFGRRWTILSGQVFCLIGAIVAATASSVTNIIAGSTFLGFGGGMIFVAYAGVSEILPNKWRGTGLAAIELAINVYFGSRPFGIPSVLIATSVNAHTALKWRWCYYWGLVSCVVSSVGVFTFYFPPPRPQYDIERTRWQELKDIDFVGLSLYLSGLTTFLIGLTWAGGAGHPWRSASVIIPVVMGFTVLLSAFVFDFVWAKQPIFPLKIFKKFREYTVLLGITFVAGDPRSYVVIANIHAGINFYSLSALLPQGSLFMYTNNPIQIGLIALPNGVSQFVFGAMVTALLGKFKRLKLQMITACTIQTIFCAVLATIVPKNVYAWSALQVFILGPFSWIVVLCYVAAGVNIPLQYLGLALGLIGTFRSMGGSVGNAIFNTILNGVVNNNLGSAIAKVALSTGQFDPANISYLIGATIKNAAGVPGAFATVPGITPAVEAASIQALRDVYAKGFRMISYSTIPFNVIAIVLALIMFDPSEYLTNHTAVRLETEHKRKKDVSESNS